MTECIPGLVIAGTHSGCGKTQVALALAAALMVRGFRVQGFKVGPDFIDPSHMTAVTGRATHNLDGWMLSRDTVLELFQRRDDGSDFCLVEGVMGLFDGASGREETGSTAQMAKWLGLPVVLVVDARSQGRSVAALVRGFRDFDPDLRLAGVMFTKVGGPEHARILREAMRAYLPELPCLGCLPRRPDLALPSRHLGLHTARDVDWGAQQRKTLSAWIERDADVPDLLVLAKTRIDPLPGAGAGATGVNQNNARPVMIRLAVALDRAFCFYYQENLDLLRRAGAELAFFSPLADKDLPRDVQGLYLGGGYPELHASKLSANESMRACVLRAARSGMPMYAECGGFLYLLSDLQDLEGRGYSMAGVFSLQARMCSRFQALGYREVTLAEDCLLGNKGNVLRGHEFHYSSLDGAMHESAQAAYLVRDRQGREYTEGLRFGNVLASYIHLHFGSCPRAAAALVAACAAWPKALKYKFP
ncbi:MAG TPA: cobyrinate a,c-diamide synthase [Desulfonatronum sp.]|nr:cobyrinate a,c-diamide synthase [Desulfonatronum sp.]